MVRPGRCGFPERVTRTRIAPVTNLRVVGRAVVDVAVTASIPTLKVQALCPAAIAPKSKERSSTILLNRMNAAENRTIELSMAELREITTYALACAEPALAIFERDCPDDPRARAVLDEARRFAAGGRRTKALRVTALAAHRAARTARESEHEAAANAADAAGAAGSSAYLHPLARATQVLHILGSAAHAARAFELDAGDDHGVGDDHIEKARGLAGPTAVSVLMRYPSAPGGRGRVGELLRRLDASLRHAEAGSVPPVGFEPTLKPF
jgi:hypothetical protein